MVTERPLSRYGAGIALSAVAHAAFFLLFLRIKPDVSFDIIAPVKTSFITVTRPHVPAPAVQQPRPPAPAPAPAVPEPAAVPAPAPEPAVTQVQTAPPADAAPAAPVTDAPPAAPAAPATVAATALDGPDFTAVYAPHPSYPDVALNLELEGTVIVRALVNPEGKITDRTIIKLNGHPSFGRAALAAVKARRYPPPTAGGKPVFVWIEIPFEFSLEEY